MRILNKITSLVAIASVATNLFAQKPQFDKDEFDFVFKKNCRVNNVYTPREDYLNLYVNYKLKVAEARNMQLDTLSSYKRECKLYQDELIAPYLVDSTAIEAYKNTVRERVAKRIHGSHILVPIATDASPKDTLAAYNRIALIRDSLLKIASNKGDHRERKRIRREDLIEEDLGFFTTLQMVAPFEEAAFNTPVGGVSEIIRTQFGYHVMRVYEEKPARQILVAHIMRQNQDSLTNIKDMHLMDSLLHCIKAGESFEELAKKYSNDGQSAAHGGLMPWLFEDTQIPGFMSAALSLKNKDDVSGIVISPFGLHIIKYIDERTSIPEAQLNHMFREILVASKVQELSSRTIAKQTAKKYKAAVNAATLNDIMDIVLSSASDGEKKSKIDALKQPMITIGEKKIMASEVEIATTISKQQTPAEFKTAIIDKALCDYYKEQLPVENAQYKYTLAEYTDGPLVYEMNIQHVWKHQANDSTVMDLLYAQNPARYAKDGKFSGRIYVCDNSKNADKVRRAVERGKTVDKDLYVELIEGDQTQGGLYDDYLWPCYKSDCIVVDGQYTEGQRFDRQLATQQLQSDLITYREREFAKRLREKYKITHNPKL